MTVWLTSLLLLLGPNGWWIDARLPSADDAYQRLVPMEWLDDTPDSLWIAFHRRDDWLMAVYLTPDAEEMRWARAFPGAASSLRPADKRWVVEEVLGAAWTGDPEVDFAWFCAQ